MKSFLVANAKGGSGKSTLATNLAGYFARCGHTVMLGDTDRQQSSRAWLAIRPFSLPLIRTWDIDKEARARPPKGTTHVVLDSPAGLRGKTLEQILKKVGNVIVPIQPSLFDMLATQSFLTTLLNEKAVRKEKISVAVVGMRVDSRTRAAAELDRFLDSFDIPVLTHLRDTQLYVHLAASGKTIFDLSLANARKDLEEWKPILEWVSKTSQD